MKGAVTLFALVVSSSACSMLLGLDEAEFDPSVDGNGDGGSHGGAAADSSGGSADGEPVAGAAGAGGASEP